MKNSKFNINTRLGRNSSKTDRPQQPVSERGVDKSIKTQKSTSEKKTKKIVGKPNIEAIKQQMKKKEASLEKNETSSSSEEEPEEDDFFEEITSILTQDKKIFLTELDKITVKIKPEDEDAPRLTDLIETLKKISDHGVFVQTDTLSSLVDLLKVLDKKNIPFSGFTIQELDENDVKRCSKMLEAKKYEYAAILSLSTQEIDIPIDELKDCKLIVGTSTDDLLEKYQHYCDELVAIWPSIVSVVSIKDRFITIKVDDGKVRVGSIFVAIENDEFVEFGRVLGMERLVNSANVVVKMDRKVEEIAPKLLYSKISRNSIDKLKKMYPDQINDKMANLITKLKGILKINE